MGQDNAVPRKINGVEGAAGEVIISGGPGVIETWDAPAPAAHAGSHEPAGADEVNDIDIGNTGVLLSAHKDRHDPQTGADPLDCAAPGAIDENANAEGVADTLARSDHNHQHTAALHENGGGAEISVANLSGLLGDDQHVLDVEVTAVAIAKTLLTTRGDIIFRNATVPARLAKGNLNDVLTQGANDPAWAAPAGGAATKEFFVPATGALGGAAFGQVDKHTGVRLDASGEDAFIEFHVPADFSSIDEVVIAVLPNATEANADWDISSQYGTNGQAFNNHSETDNASTYNVVNNQFFEVDISGILTALAADDYVGIRLRQSTVGHNLIVLGVRLKYN